MRYEFPRNARPIHTPWRIKGGGLGVAAYTDDASRVFLGLYRFDRTGQQINHPLYLERRRFMSPVLAGYSGASAIAVFMDIEVNFRGLDVRICPPLAAQTSGAPLHLWAHWNDQNAFYPSSRAFRDPSVYSPTHT